MKLLDIHIENVGGIPDLLLKNLNPQINIICGENGVGKTNILDSVAYMFSTYTTNSITLRKGATYGKISINTTNTILAPLTRLLNEYSVRSEQYINNDNGDIAKQLLSLKVNRVFTYKKENSIKVDKDPQKQFQRNDAGVDNDDLKNWLVVRKGFDQINLTDTQRRNSELITQCFSILNNEYSFSTAKTDFEVYVKTPTSNDEELHFENLSSGFKSTLFILLGIIKELDLRFNNIKSADEFDGIILIDEIELHLHPQWQGNICSILKSVFPLAQFFITTHSPHVVQTAQQNEVIALQRIEGERYS